MYLFKSILCFKEIEKDCERFLVQSKKKTIVDVVNIALANLKFHAVHATSEYICNTCVMVSSRREIICSRTWKNYRNLWEPESWPCFSCCKIRVKIGLTAYTTPTVRDICSFAVLFLVSRPFCRFTLVYEGRFMLCYKEKLEPSDRAMANF